MKMAESDKKKMKVELEAMWFAAGTAVFMACFGRGILVLSFFEQWRVLVFLALNLLLLAILFTSTRPILSSKDEINDLKPPIESELEHLEKSIECKSNEDVCEIEANKEEEEEEIVEMVEEEEEEEELSKEELNGRVEAFIAMFRQHLASDGKVKSFCKVAGDNNNVDKHRGAAAAASSGEFEFINCRTSISRQKHEIRTVGSCI